MKQQDTTKNRRLELKNVSPKQLQDVTLEFEDFYQSINQDWLYKSRRLQARRWRKIKHQLI